MKNKDENARGISFITYIEYIFFLIASVYLFEFGITSGQYANDSNLKVSVLTVGSFTLLTISILIVIFYWYIRKRYGANVSEVFNRLRKAYLAINIIAIVLTGVFVTSGLGVASKEAITSGNDLSKVFGILFLGPLTLGFMIFYPIVTGIYTIYISLFF